ncbi:MAG: hypothetical protein OSB65_03550 [Roseibacillus sp.]|nr:hypothetical protein [Roseibacillus sp.]
MTKRRIKSDYGPKRSNPPLALDSPELRRIGAQGTAVLLRIVLHFCTIG